MATIHGYLIYQQDGKEERFPLRIGSYAIGSASSNELVLKAEGVSREHARIYCTPDGCQIRNLSSTNGTVLNNTRLQTNEPVPLRHGDEIRLGRAVLRYEAAASQALEWPAPASAQPPAAPPKTPATPTPPRPPAPPRPQPGPPPASKPVALPRPPRQGDIDTKYVPRDLAAPRRGHLSRYMPYLPGHYQAGPENFLNRFLLIFESLLAPVERTIGQFYYVLNPLTTPSELMQWLATWLSLVLNENWDTLARRTLMRRAAELYRLRGTRKGLSEYLKIYTGVEPLIVERWQKIPIPSYAALPEHVFLVIVPEDPKNFERSFIEAIIDSEKPAHTSYYLEFAAPNSKKS